MKKKMLSLFFILTIAFTLSFPTALFADISPTRLAGSDRYSTASAIAMQGWTKSDYAVIVYGANFPDALSSTPLAKKYDAPILLTTTNSLPTTTKQTLVNLKVKNVFIVGGTGIISTKVEAELESMGITTTRISGKDRYDTSAQIAKQVNANPSEIFVVTGLDYPDALSVAPIASSKQSPIILVPKDYIPDTVKNYIDSININQTYIIGSADIISNNVLNQLPNAERIIGADKYSRNVAINKKFDSEFEIDSVSLSTGEGFADALTGAAYASKEAMPIILVNNAPSTNTKTYYQNRLANGSKVYVFGGTGVISNNVISDLSYIKYSFSDPADLNTYQTITVTNDLLSGNFKAEIAIKQIIRGDEAWSKIYAANQFNTPPKDGYEYLMAYIDYKLLDISEGKSISLFGNVHFKLVSQDGRVYSDFYSVVEPDPQFNTTLYKGASTEGWVSFFVKKTDLKPVISYYVNYDGTGGAWFKAYGDSVNSSVQTTPTTPSSAPISPTVPNVPTNIITIPIPTNNNDNNVLEKYLKEQYELDLSDLRIKANNLESEINKVMNDKRFNYVDAEGNKTLTYNRSKVIELQNQLEDINQRITDIQNILNTYK